MWTILVLGGGIALGFKFRKQLHQWYTTLIDDEA